MFGLLAKLVVLLAVLWIGVPLAMEAADAVSAQTQIPSEKILKIAAVAFGLFVLANWRPESGRGGSRRGRR